MDTCARVAWILLANALLLHGAGARVMSLCDCQEAQGQPHGLTCEKEGHFVRGFERSGAWVSGGGGVPLSKAVCCRPCFEDGGKGRGNETTWTNATVVSAACNARPHEEDGDQGAYVSCGTSSNAFLAGFERASPVTLAADIYYPSGGAVCRAAALVNATGDTRRLERCECTDVMDASCGGAGTNMLLWGFGAYRTLPFQMEQVTVPMAPAKCCKVCLADESTPPDQSCPNGCSNRGVCNFGCCICDEGFTGDDCSQDEEQGVPVFSQPWILVAFCLMTFSTLGFIGFLVQQVAANQVLATFGNSNQNNEAQPLLREDGLSGTDLGESSEGQSDWDESSEDLEEGRHAMDLGSRPLAHEQDAGVSHSAPTTLHTEHHRRRHREEEGPEPGVAREEEEELDVDDQKEANKKAKARGAYGQDFECLICMSRRIQVVAIPCGHACSCRHCARRLRRCPICREVVTRRQKLYIGQ